MSDLEKQEQSSFHVRGGYLRTYTWEEAWSNYWRDCGDEERQRVLNLPNFDWEIFTEITGITPEQSHKETIQIGGEVYEVTDELKAALVQLRKA